MRTQSMDTSPEAERVQIELIRKAPPALRVTDLLERALVDAGLKEEE